MNPQIEAAREAALKILKPTPRELEHGLALHRELLVWDAYGFAPRSAVDGDALRRAYEEGASETEQVDLMEEQSALRHLAGDAQREEYHQAWEAAGVTCIFQNAGVESQDPLELLKRLSYFTYAVDRTQDLYVRATVPEDVERAKDAGRRCLYLSANAVPIPPNPRTVEEALSYIKVFFRLGHRMMHLTYNRRNLIGDGCGESSDSGLSDFGRLVIQEMNRAGVIVDVAHAGQRTSLEAARVSAKPVVASHTACASLHPHIRCKTDEVIEAIVDSGGYIGICCIPGFLGRSQDIAALLDHIDYVAKRFGPDYVAIGTDVAYTATRMGAELAKAPRRPARARWENFWPRGSRAESGPATGRASLAWTNWPLFTVGLVQRGYSDEEIAKIVGGNVLRVAKAVLQ